MDWNQSVRFLQDQGPVFWTAAAAVAAGAALLAAAAVLQLRRHRRRRSAGPAVRLTETGYAARPALPTAGLAAVAPTGPDPRLGELRDRLAAAAARLEELQARRAAAPGASVLKTSPKRVEYVHRSGQA